MKIIVNDANILIDLVDLRILPYFFQLEFEFHTTALILDELFDEQREELIPYIETGKLILHLQSTDESIIKDEAEVNKLIDQVYQFSRMYWKSVSQQSLPVTTKYPEMVAEIYPHFEGGKLYDFGKKNLWFL